ncbi:MAG TPA: hypothetical protein VMG55_09450 [Stellaceae bacterium]|nr:hypothetical protein [Stellaceae bacterium]
MFGWSISKLVTLVAMIAAAWYLFKMLGGSRLPRARQASPPPGPGPQPAQQAPRVEAEEMIACKSCGTYVSAVSARHCGRTDCPWSR